MKELPQIIFFVSIILAVFGYGAWLWLRQWRLLKLEQTDLEFLDTNLRTMPEGAVNDPRVGLNNENGVVRQRVEAILELKERSGRLDLDALSHIAEAQVTNDNTPIRYIAGVLILLGLLGTLIGLIGAVSGLSETISSLNVGDVKELTKTFRNFSTISLSLVSTLGGMKTAFYASLFGVGATIVLTFMVSILARRQNEFLANLDNLTLRSLAPVYFPQEQTRSLDQFVSAMQQTSSMLDLMTRKIRTDVSKSESSFNYLTTLVTTFNKFTESFQGEYETVQKELTGQIKNLQKTIADRDANNAQLIETVNNMATLSKDTLVQVQSAMEAFRQDIGANSADFKRQMEAFFERIVEGAFTESLKNFEKTVASLQDIKTGLVTNQEKSTDALLTLQNYFHHEDRLGNTITVSSGKVESKVGESIKILQEVLEKSAQNDDRLGQRIVESSGKVESKVEESIKTMVESSGKVESKVGESVKILQEALEKSAKNEAELLNLTQKVMELQKQNGRLFLAPPRPSDATGMPMSEEVVPLLQDIVFQTQKLNALMAQQLDNGGGGWLAPFRRLFRAWRRSNHEVNESVETKVLYELPSPAGDFAPASKTMQKSHPAEQNVSTPAGEK